MNKYYNNDNELSIDEVHDSLREMLQKIDSFCDSMGLYTFVPVALL